MSQPAARGSTEEAWVNLNAGLLATRCGLRQTAVCQHRAFRCGAAAWQTDVNRELLPANPVAWKNQSVEAVGVFPGRIVPPVLFAFIRVIRGQLLSGVNLNQRRRTRAPRCERIGSAQDGEIWERMDCGKEARPEGWRCARCSRRPCRQMVRRGSASLPGRTRGSASPPMALLNLLHFSRIRPSPRRQHGKQILAVGGDELQWSSRTAAGRLSTGTQKIVRRAERF